MLNKFPEDVGLASQLVPLLGSNTTLAEDALETGELLGRPPLVILELLEHPDIVLGVLLLGGIGQRSSLLLDLLSHLRKGRAAGELGNNVIERGDGAGSGVETTADDAVGACLLIDKVHEALFRAGIVVDLRLRGALGEVLDGRVRGDALGRRERLAVFRLGVDLGDQNVLIPREVLGDGLPDRSEGLAIWKRVRRLRQLFIDGEGVDPRGRVGEGKGEPRTSAPRGRKGHENMLITANFLIKSRVTQHNNSARGFLGLLGPDARLLGDEAGQALNVAAAIVFLGRVARAVEPLQGRKALDFESFTQFSLGVGVDLGDLDFVLLVFERESQLLVHGSEVLAMTTPRGKELNESGLARLIDNTVEIGWEKVDNGRPGSSGSCKSSDDESL